MDVSGGLSGRITFEKFLDGGGPCASTVVTSMRACFYILSFLVWFSIVNAHRPGSPNFQN